MKQQHRKNLTRVVVVAALVAVVALVWMKLRPSGLGEGFASANGRIEATEVDVASKLAGRLLEIEVEEGDFVQAGQILARMDTQVLVAQLNQAQAQVRQAQNATRTAHSQVSLRQSEKVTAEAVVRQRRAELSATQKRHERTAILVKRNALPRQQLDDDLAALQSGQAALAAAQSQVVSAQAGIEAAQSQVIEAESAVQAAQASVERLQADIEDSQLKAPRSGRVQYRISQPGEVLAAGGKVLNLVDLNDVYMNIFLPSQQAGRVALGSDVHLVLDAAPQYVIPAKVTFVASVAQFTPKTVETASEREKLMFRIKARIDPDLLKAHLEQVKTGIPGMAYLKLDAAAEWPQDLQIRIPQ
ncbi:glycoside hydrolase family 43 [Pseudomonas daroniae]|uniref:Glycoside hydrolase family 43 n=1 Tax=Phytopseudomonas daroniae TaxID=2487519 RepID=A0A4V2KB15_9GAMM|nr:MULTISPECIES: HlyD family efflux transporter periplasmic adaptor subunit [Pseudomonas]TBU81964.1 glycoside hydrolase family 43 [Pseudomonas daroniae]TBU84698.1 glycoside hydrolase family 43 [Pseudomonas sp. FRB 228]TBU92266.1 glycoside hydrolase family 43 [Pseudomonas daroniae]